METKSPALIVILHAKKKRKKGKNPSLWYKGERNPRKALALAIEDYQKELRIPKISDEVLAERMKQIKYVDQAMSGIDGIPYPTAEEDEKYFDLFYVETKCNPQTQSFNFDEEAKLTTKATNIVPILTKDIFVKIGGYYGFCKITFAEVLAQIPEEIISKVVAFALDPKESAKILDDDYQSKSIIFYGKGEENQEDDSLPSVKDLIKPLDIEKAERLKVKVRPILNFNKDGYRFIDPGDINQPFIKVGIWMRINGSNLHENNTDTVLDFETKKGERISTYQPFNSELGADTFHPNYADTISQIPDEFITENTVGFLYHFTDYFKTKEGVIHKTEYSLIEKV